MRLYWNYFDQIKSKLPTQFVKIFQSGDFHDSEITSIIFSKFPTKKRNVYNITLSIENDEFKGEIVHQNVKKYTNSFVDISKYGCLCEYLYGEILYENELWIHNIRFAQNNELSICCKSINWVSL